MFCNAKITDPQVFVALNSFVIERGKGSKRIACILTYVLFQGVYIFYNAAKLQ